MPPTLTDVDWPYLQNGSDIRGVALAGVPQEAVNLTPAVAQQLGHAFVAWLADQLDKAATDLVIAVGRDSRLSGPSLMQAFMTGVTAMGSQVYDFGLASTPAMFMSTVNPDLCCDGAVMLTASHLPFNRNGFKFFTAHGGLDKPDITDILARSAQGVAPAPTVTPGTLTPYDFMAVYADGLVQWMRSAVNHPHQFEQPLQGLKIIVDAGNGAGGFYASQVLQPLGADTTGSQFLDPDGTFPNHIPNPENKGAMASIREAVLAHQADLGIIFDTDVDRSAAVDPQGNELNRNRLIALVATIVLREHPGSAIVTDSITSEGLTQFITNLGGIHHRFKRGYKNVINEAIRLNATGQESWLAIETSGHAAMRENYFLDDGAYLISKLLIELARLRINGQRLTDLIATLQEPVESEEFRITIQTEDFQSYGNEVIAKLTAFAETQSDWEIVPNNYEGIRIRCQSPAEAGWFLLRLSLHDPVLPLNVEANVAGGVRQISDRLLAFFQTIPSLDFSSLSPGNP